MRFAYCSVFLLLLLVPNFAHAEILNSYRITYSFTPSTTTSNGFWIPVAEIWNGFPSYDAEVRTISPSTGTKVEMENGVSAIHWPQSEFGNKLSVTFDVEVHTQQQGVSLTSNYDAAYDTDDAFYQASIGSSPWAQSDNAAIIAKAEEVVGSETDRMAQAKALMSWVNSNMTYADGIRQDAVTAFTQLKGDCGGYSNLYVAMCRAVGIPARIESGIYPINEWGFAGQSFTDGTWSAVDWDRRFATHIWATILLPHTSGSSIFKVDPTYPEFNSARESITFGRGDQIALGSVVRPWLHLPYALYQAQDSSVKISIVSLGAVEIAHPEPEPAVYLEGALSVLLGE